jgi:Lecithin retinol acyltransferase
MLASALEGGEHDVSIATEWRPTRRGLQRSDRLLVHDEEPPLGAHLVTPRRGFAHHGIYVGNGRVVHYGSFPLYWRRGAVEEVSFASFAFGHPVWVRPHAVSRFAAEEVRDRARSRLGESCYRLFTNNCEHFCEWCIGGEPRSYQVEGLLSPFVMRAVTRSG